MAKNETAVAVKKRKSGKRFWQTENFQGYMFMIPTLIGWPLFCGYPLITSLYCSFCDWNGVNPPVWAGLKNYTFILTIDPIFPKSLKITMIYALINVPMTLILGLALALLLRKRLPGIKLFRTVYYLPTIIPGVATMILWKFIFQSDTGLLNGILKQIGLQPVGWLTDENVVLISLSIIRWWAVGGTMMIFLSGLQSVPADLYEAAELDGAGNWAKFRNVTIPMISPILFLQLITGLIGCLQVFNEASIMTDGGPNYGSYFVNYDIYMTAFNLGSKFGRACAEAWILFVIIAVLTVVTFKFSDSYVFYEND